ncbi:MAG: hypothetical protein H7Z20_05475 [Bdellovibrio sp.]|nr:hypothetical protein [Methylotenera sp.]
MAFDLGGLLQQYLGGNAPSATDTQAHFDEVAQNAAPSTLSKGLSAMFHSDQTPPFSQSASQMFGQADPNQKAGMLNQLIAGMGPAVLASLLSGAGGAAIASVLGKSTTTTDATITPEQAAQLSPEQVQQMADHAQQNNPSIVDHMSDFYAQHSGLIKTLGGAALAIALAKMANNNKGA